MTDRHFHPLTLVKKINQTDLACTLEFEVPDEFKELYKFKAGQYLTFKVIQDGQELRRSYSINSCSYDEEPLQVTVKKVQGGKVSNHFVDELKVGDILPTMPPLGQFVLPEIVAHKTYFYAAGSGITPIYGLIKTILHSQKTVHVELHYGNYSRNQVIFYDDLEALAQYYNSRFEVIHHFTDEVVVKPKKSIFKKIFDLDNTDMIMGSFVPGDFTSEKLLELSQEKGDFLSADHYICGPGQMIPELEAALLSIGVSSNQIHHEYFAAADAQAPTENTTETNSGQPSGAIGPAKLTVILDGETDTFDLPVGETVLRASIEEGLSVPYACESGVCATCKAKCLEGEVKMRSNSVLSNDELAQGYILTCQSEAVSEKLVVDYDAV